MLVAQGNLTEALKSYRESLAIRGSLDLSVSHMRIADVASKSNDKATARTEFSAAREISARLAVLSPDNANWKNDLAWIDRQLAALGR